VGDEKAYALVAQAGEFGTCDSDCVEPGRDGDYGEGKEREPLHGEEADTGREGGIYMCVCM
jgi:hypothetical protein